MNSEAASSSDMGMPRELEPRPRSRIRRVGGEWEDFDPATESNIKTCKCGRAFNFVCFDATGCFERPRCSFCSAPSEKCFVCGEAVKAPPWVEHEGQRIHANSGAAGKWNCSFSLMMWQNFGVGRRPVGDSGRDASGAQGHAEKL